MDLCRFFGRCSSPPVATPCNYTMQKFPQELFVRLDSAQCDSLCAPPSSGHRVSQHQHRQCVYHHEYWFKSVQIQHPACPAEVTILLSNNSKETIIIIYFLLQCVYKVLFYNHHVSLGVFSFSWESESWLRLKSERFSYKCAEKILRVSSGIIKSTCSLNHIYYNWNDDWYKCTVLTSNSKTPNQTRRRFHSWNKSTNV